MNQYLAAALLAVVLVSPAHARNELIPDIPKGSKIYIDDDEEEHQSKSKKTEKPADKKKEVKKEEPKKPAPKEEAKPDIVEKETPKADAPPPPSTPTKPTPTLPIPPQAATPMPVKKTEVKDNVVLKLGNEEIRNSEVMEVWKGLFPGANPPDFNTFNERTRQDVLRGIISERLLYQEAVKAGLDRSEEVKKRLDNMRKQVMIQTFMESKAKFPVSDADLKKAYTDKINALKNIEEVRARHVLLAREDEAQAIEKQLKSGGDFEKIAREKSIDKGSAAQGGDLGYFTKEKMVSEFSDAAFKLKKGQISEPVKSQFGWHVIRVEDRRKVPAPTYDQIKDQLKAELQNKAMQQYVENLIKTANITYYGPDGKPREFSRETQPEAQ